MTTPLIPVFSGTISSEPILLCNARELHKFLDVGKRFASWITERISEYGFVENQDYILISPNRETKGRGGDRRSKDYHLTLDTAKELAMVERNEQGRQVRRYFIECEKRLNQPQVTTPLQRTPLRDAVNLLVGLRGMTYQEAYALIHQRFGVSHIDQLTQIQMLEAIEYIHCMLIDDRPSTLPMNGRILVTFKNGEMSAQRVLSNDEHIATLPAFFDMVRKARYLVIHEDDAAPLIRAFSGSDPTPIPRQKVASSPRRIEEF